MSCPASAGAPVGGAALAGATIRRLLARQARGDVFGQGADRLERLGGQLVGIYLQTERVLQVIANSWQQIGVEADLNFQDIRTIWGPEGYQFTEVETAGAYSWFNGNDPDNTFYWHSSQIPDDPQGTGGNLVAYFNEFDYQDEIDELTERGATTIDQDERREIYWEIQELLHEELPVIFIYWSNLIFVSPSNLRGFEPNAFTRLFYNVHEWHYTS
jgi:peptide/nickel transport system substrate-binding protein